MTIAQAQEELARILEAVPQGFDFCRRVIASHQDALISLERIASRLSPADIRHYLLDTEELLRDIAKPNGLIRLELEESLFSFGYNNYPTERHPDHCPAHRGGANQNPCVSQGCEPWDEEVQRAYYTKQELLQIQLDPWKLRRWTREETATAPGGVS